jgi:hypothetical protein
MPGTGNTYRGVSYRRLCTDEAGASDNGHVHELGLPLGVLSDMAGRATRM